MRIERVWAMPNRWTYKIKPIREFLDYEMGNGGQWCDPFAGKYSPAQMTNDINLKLNVLHHQDALVFLKDFPSETFDGVLFDPPYSPTQMKRNYEENNLVMPKRQTGQEFWSKCKDECARIIKPGGKIICFGWNSNGAGKKRGFTLIRVLLVAHGGGRNDTICTIELKDVAGECRDLFVCSGGIVTGGA